MPVFVSSSQAAVLFDEIRAARPRPGLTFGVPLAAGIAKRIQQASDLQLLGARVTDEALAAAVRAGLLLWADHMEASHAISQDLGTTEGSYWHGILHRREPDFSNAGYWFRRVGRHQVFAALGEAAGGRWDPFAFIHRCEAAVTGRDAGKQIGELERLQALEMELLLAHSAAGATAPGGA